MATIIRTDLVIHQPITDYEARVIEANRRMAGERIIRIDYRHLPDGLSRFIKALEAK